MHLVRAAVAGLRRGLGLERSDSEPHREHSKQKAGHRSRKRAAIVHAEPRLRDDRLKLTAIASAGGNGGRSRTEPGHSRAGDKESHRVRLHKL